MKLFGKKKRKKDEEEEDLEGEGEEKADKKKKKRKPRKKRTPPPKPWGRKERIIVAMLLLGTIVVSALLSLQTQNWEFPKLPRLSFSEIKMPFLGKETIIIEGTGVDQENNIRLDEY